MEFQFAVESHRLVSSERVVVALDAVSQWRVNLERGSRTNHTTNRLVKPIKPFGNFTKENTLKITIDKFAAYR